MHSTRTVSPGFIEIGFFNRVGDTVRVECTFDPTLRQKIPQLKVLEPRYVTWGEGSSDEMCLGVLSGTTE